MRFNFHLSPPSFPILVLKGLTSSALPQNQGSVLSPFYFKSCKKKISTGHCELNKVVWLQRWMLYSKPVLFPGKLGNWTQLTRLKNNQSEPTKIYFASYWISLIWIQIMKLHFIETSPYITWCYKKDTLILVVKNILVNSKTALRAVWDKSSDMINLYVCVCVHIQVLAEQFWTLCWNCCDRQGVLCTPCLSKKCCIRKAYCILTALFVNILPPPKHARVGCHWLRKWVSCVWISVMLNKIVIQ